jgi:hypothetical protein
MIFAVGSKKQNNSYRKNNTNCENEWSVRRVKKIPDTVFHGVIIHELAIM